MSYQSRYIILSQSECLMKLPHTISFNTPTISLFVSCHTLKLNVSYYITFHLKSKINTNALSLNGVNQENVISCK